MWPGRRIRRRSTRSSLLQTSSCRTGPDGTEQLIRVPLGSPSARRFPAAGEPRPDTGAAAGDRAAIVSLAVRTKSVYTRPPLLVPVLFWVSRRIKRPPVASPPIGGASQKCSCYMHGCPCGYHGDPTRECRWSIASISTSRCPRCPMKKCARTPRALRRTR